MIYLWTFCSLKRCMHACPFCRVLQYCTSGVQLLPVLFALDVFMVIFKSPPGLVSLSSRPIKVWCLWPERNLHKNEHVCGQGLHKLLASALINLPAWIQCVVDAQAVMSRLAVCLNHAHHPSGWPATVHTCMWWSSLKHNTTGSCSNNYGEVLLDSAK